MNSSLLVASLVAQAHSQTQEVNSEATDLEDPRSTDSEHLQSGVDQDMKVSWSFAGRRVAGPGSGYVHRWAVNIDEWNPVGEDEGPEFQYLLNLIREENDRKGVTKFRSFNDQKRALISRLMVRQASASALNHHSFQRLTVRRTRGNKPFLASPLPPLDEAPNWNVNCSHEGSWVLCASERFCLVGVDVAEERLRDKNGELIDFYEGFGEMLTQHEMDAIRATGGTHEEQYEQFSRYWSAKEAFTKARGDGLGYALKKAQFHFSPLPGFPQGTAYEGVVLIEGRGTPLWRLVQHKMPPTMDGRPHWTTVALGPVSDTVDHYGEFTKTLRKPQPMFRGKEWKEILHSASPQFDDIPVSFLVPEDEIQGYLEALRAAI